LSVAFGFNGRSAVVIAVLSLAMTRMAGAQRLPPSGFEVGQPFPTLAFPALDDATPRSITDFRGKKVILHVFASW
jgi:hypothetical protein